MRISFALIAVVIVAYLIGARWPGMARMIGVA